MSLLQELQRRNVFRIALAYILTTWLLLQVADVVLNNIGAPDWVFKAMQLVLALGSLPAVLFAWAYELTPEGVKREKDVDRSQSVTHMTGRKLDRTIIIIVVLAVGYFAYNKPTGGSTRDTDAQADATSASDIQLAQQGAAGAAVLDGSSIAVLPFVNMSSDAEQDYFSDGISEELLNLLAKIPEFRVAGRTSHFAFKGRNDDLRDIGKSLGVANILEGSVRKSGNRVRITAQLVQVEDGFHL